jgi:hypothetical protein
VLCVLQRDDDYSKGRDFIPYRDVIMRACSWLVADAKPGDSLFFHYSGHGGSMKDPTCEYVGKGGGRGRKAGRGSIKDCGCSRAQAQI